MPIYKFIDASPTNLICNHVKEALEVIKLDGDFFRASLSIHMAKNLMGRLEGFAEKLPDDFQMDDPDNLGFGYYTENPPYAIIKFKGEINGNSK
jgi:hypothetical protein